MHVGGVFRTDFCSLKTKVVIAVRLLGRTTGMHDVYLRCHLIVRTKPRFAGGINRRVGVIAQKDFLWAQLNANHSRLRLQATTKIVPP